MFGATVQRGRGNWHGLALVAFGLFMTFGLPLLAAWLMGLGLGLGILWDVGCLIIIGVGYAAERA